MISNSFVSVVIPTNKRELNYLQRAVESVLNQTYTNYEIVIVDDNSEIPECRKIVSDYVNSLNNDKIRLFLNEKNLGGSLTRNRGIDESRGEYIAFLDDDDAFLPYRIEKMLAFMQEEDCDFAFSNLLMRTNNGKIVDYRTHRGMKSNDNDYLLHYQLTKNISGTSSFMFRTDAIRKIGGFKDAKMGQDFYIVMRAVEGGLKIRYFDSDSVIIYKHSDGGISQGRNKITGENNLFEFKKGYFDILTKDEINYVKFRHYAVMAVAYKRNKMILPMIGSGFSAFFSSPADCLKEVSGFFKNVTGERRNDEGVPTEIRKNQETVTK
ncbi:MAG: glycosyltransferase family 2 protein [Ruminococcus sp.]|nr:glycosyltransferase family 2 protein [Candidatus Copronaster equi]